MARVACYLPLLASETFGANMSPGSRHGNQIVFPRLGYVEVGKIPGYLIMVEEEETHAVFQRRRYDLWGSKKVPLIEYLTKEALVELLCSGKAHGSAYVGY
ncbi:hypothetical protein ACH5RR_006912 [Cinchona calisaya]|uniref:Uncharacterized protein n=1 Tax=Cinchona calisaya TaxID=153742 RepID=A0ABD3AQP5_9GENT